MQLKRREYPPSLAVADFLLARSGRKGASARDPREFDGQLAPRNQTPKRHGERSPWARTKSFDGRRFTIMIATFKTHVTKFESAFLADADPVHVNGKPRAPV